MANLTPYQPLYGKYRPQQFADVVGQNAIMQTLQNAITGNQLAHAYLFCGPRGTGKTSTARILAKSINCEKGPTLTPCQTCASCTGITQGNGLDVIEIDAASHNGVDDMRELMETCQFAPMMGKYKIYIIDEVHMLSTSAFNALLKTLEEPPAHVIFIFATTEAHKVLPTIISRCQRYDFSRIRVGDLVPHLNKVAQAEAIQIQDDALLAIARHARGGLRDALSLLDQVGVLSKTQADYTISLDDVTRFLGGLSDETLIALLTAIQQQNVGTLLTLLDKQQQEGIEPRVMVQGLTQAYRNLMLIHACKDNPVETLLPLLGISEPALEQLKPLAEAHPSEEYPQILTQLTELNNRIKFQANPQLWLETGLTQLAFRNQLHTIEELAQRISQLESGTTPAPAASTARPSTPAPTATPQPLPQSPMAVAPTQSTQSAPQAATAPQPHPSTSATAPVAEPVASAAPSPQPAASVATMAMPEPAPTPSPSLSPSPAITPTHAPANTGGLQWEHVINAITSIPVKTMVMQQAQLMGVEGHVAIIGCSSQAILNTLKNPRKLAALQDALTAVNGSPMEARLEVSEGAVNPAVAIPPPATSAVPAAPAAQPMQPATPMATAPPATTLPTANSPAFQPSSELGQPTHEAGAPQPDITGANTDYSDTPGSSISGNDMDEEWAEAKQHVAQLLQGKPL